MKSVVILMVLLASALASGQKFDVTDLSKVSSPISFDGTAKPSKTGTVCTVTMRNNSTQRLMAVEISGEVTSPWGWMQTTGLSYDSFFKEAGGITPGEEFDLVGHDLFVSQVREYINGVPVKPQEPKKDLICHAAFNVQFIQLEDGSTSGDYQIMKDVMARRAKKMTILRHLIEAYDTGGQAAFAAALDEPESTSVAYPLNGMAAYMKLPLIDLVRQRLAVAQKRQASGIF